MYIRFNESVHELLAEAIAADEILGDREAAENYLIYAATQVSRFYGGMFPNHGTLILPADFQDRPALAEILSNITGGLVYLADGQRISGDIINKMNEKYKNI